MLGAGWGRGATIYKTYMRSIGEVGAHGIINLHVASCVDVHVARLYPMHMYGV